MQFSSSGDNNNRSSILRLGSAWHEERGHELEQLTNEIVSRVAQLQRKNNELVVIGERNTELLSALQQSIQNVTQSQRSMAAHRSIVEVVLHTVGQMLERAEEQAIALMQATKKHEYTDGYTEVILRTTRLQKEISSLLADTGDDEPAHDDHEAERKTAEFFQEASNSILSIADLLRGLLSEEERPFTGSISLERRDGCQDVTDQNGVAPVNGSSAANDGALSMQTAGGSRSIDEGWPEAKIAGGSGPLARPDSGPTRLAPTVAEEKAERPADYLLDRDAINRQPGPPRLVPVQPRNPSASALSASGYIEVVASPFDNLAAMRGFCRAVHEISDVVEVRPAGFDKDTLHLKVKYSGDRPLASLLIEVPEFNVRLVHLNVGRVVVNIRTSMDSWGA